MAALSHPPQIHIVSSANPQSIIMNSNDDSAVSSKITHSKLNKKKYIGQMYIYVHEDNYACINYASHLMHIFTLSKHHCLILF